jgi:hypothetical protein
MNGAEIRFRILVRNYDYSFDAGELLDDFRNSLQRIKPFAIVEVAISSKQDPGLNLAKAVQDPFDAKIRRTRRPHGANAGGSQHGNNRFNHVRHKPGNTISRFNTQIP